MINTLRILGALVARTRPLVIAALMGAGLMVAGCGQKGPLYMPAGGSSKAKPAKAAPSPIEDDADDEVKELAPR
jgi:predicted small lipoprotein YifL